MAADGLHISISAEKLFTLGGLDFTNSMFTSLLVSALLVTLAVATRLRLKPAHEKPSGLQNVSEWIVESLYSLVHSVTGNRDKTKAFFPIIATFFLFILFNNWTSVLPGVGTIGLTHTQGEEEKVTEHAQTHAPFSVQASEPVEENAHPEKAEIAPTSQKAKVEKEDHGSTFVPIFRPGTADLNTTLALALFSVITTQIIGLKYVKLGYLKKFINFSNPIMFFVGILEIISEFAKIISFAFRLFGNVFAGEVLLVVIPFLIKPLAPIPFYGLEVFVGLIQAFVFALLSLVFFNMATVSHDH